MFPVRYIFSACNMALHTTFVIIHACHCKLQDLIINKRFGVVFPLVNSLEMNLPTEVCK